MIPYGKQEILDEDIEAVIEALKSEFITQGPYIEKFENDVATYCGVKYAVALSSCTAGLHLSYAAMGLKEGHVVWTVPNTFVATANAALYCGASVDFVDIDPKTYLMCPKALRLKLEESKLNGTLPYLVAPVHFSGQSCQMDEIYKLSQEYGFLLVEDAAHCIGASYKDRKIGSCEFSHAAVFSFHPVKIITTAEGGIVTTNDESIYKKLLILRTHGITKDPELLQENHAEPWYFEQQELGYHYRITDLQCALGSSQMNRLDSYVEKRAQLANRYYEKLATLPIILPTILNEAHSSWHLFAIQIDPLKCTKSRLEVFMKLREHGIGVNVHYIPVHTHPYYKALGFKEQSFPNAEDYYKNAITLPLYPSLTYDQQDYVCATLENIIG